MPPKSKRGATKPKSNPKAQQTQKKLAELQKAQKATQTAKEADKKRAALLEREAQVERDDRGQQSSRPFKRIRKSVAGSSDEEEPALNMVQDLLTFNADDEKEDDDEVPEEPAASQNQELPLEKDVDREDSRVDEEEGSDEEEISSKKGYSKLLDDNQVVVGDDVEPSSSGLSRCSSILNTKVTLAMFTMPCSKRIASITNRSMRRHGALSDGFPTNQQKECKAWDLENNLDMKNMLTWQGQGTMRAELVLKVRQGAPAWFGLTELESSEEVISACKWLLKDNIFLHDDINLKQRTYDKTKPWMNQGLVWLISNQFWSVKGDTIKMGKQNNLYLEFPDALLALCASVIQCALRGFLSNGKLKGMGSVVSFTDETYRSEKVSLDTSSMLKKTSTMKIDKEAIEEAAKKALVEREAAVIQSDSE
ncbi:hypothetical protein F4604DRAFT_1919314 [Suillus subluteus]|nr:hypothetical protein F4604DRAFT_1919314 [Suillus subluteus]